MNAYRHDSLALPKILQRFAIHGPADEIYAKVSLKNLIRERDCPHREFLSVALMELTSNLIKHATKGEIYIIETAMGLALASLDYGPGIINHQLAISKGYSTLRGSLGVGLYALEKHEDYRLDIFSSINEETPRRGTVILLSPAKYRSRVGVFSKPFDKTGHNGDFVAIHGSRLLIGDAAGHGIQAEKTGLEIIRLFNDWCTQERDPEGFIQHAHQFIGSRELRCAVLAVVNLNPPLCVWGVGNVAGYIIGPSGIKHLSLPQGILGENIAPTPNPCHASDEATHLILMTDGLHQSTIGDELLLRLTRDTSPQTMALSLGHFFHKLNDDATVVAVRIQEAET